MPPKQPVPPKPPAPPPKPPAPPPKPNIPPPKSGVLKQPTLTTLHESIIIDNLVVIPPDGGWGWMVAIAGFLCNFIVDGTVYTFGVFLDEIAIYFDVPPTEIALANSVMSGFYYIVAPITCGLINRYGFRPVGTTGALLASAAFAASTFFDQLIVFVVIIGVFGGFGFNMINAPGQIAVGFYFEKWRPLANSVAVAGASVGMIAFPPIFTNLLKDFHWKWKFRILSGGCLLTILCTMCYIPLVPVRVTDKRRFGSDYDDDEYDSFVSFFANEDPEQERRPRPFKERYHNQGFPTVYDLNTSPSVFTTASRKPSDNVSTYLSMYNYSPSVPSVTRSVFTGRGAPDGLSMRLSTVYENDINKAPSKCCRSRCCRSRCCVCFQNIICCGCCCLPRRTNSYIVAPEKTNRPMYRDDIFYPSSVYRLQEYQSRVSVADGPSGKKPAVAYHMSVTRAATQKDLMESDECKCCPEAVVRVVATMLDLKLLKSVSFMTLCFSGFFTLVGMYSPFIYIIQKAQELNIEPSWCNLLLTVIGLANTVGRLLCGALSSVPKVDSLVVSYITTFIAGGITIVSNYTPTLEGQIVFAIIFGLTIASFTALRTVVIVELMGLDNLTNAFGITQMLFGVASFLGVPIAGAIRKSTGSYQEPFLFAGCTIIFSGILMLPIKLLAKWEGISKK